MVMTMIERKIYLEQKTPQVEIDVVQGSILPVRFILADYTIPDEAQVRFYVMKPSGKTVYQDVSWDDNRITLHPNTQTFIEYGTNVGQVHILIGNEPVFSYQIVIHVEKNIALSEADESQDYDMFLRGADGVSPTVETEEIEGGYRLTITDIDGTHSVDLMDGTKGEKGDTGERGLPGNQGEKGDRGDTGAQGEKGDTGNGIESVVLNSDYTLTINFTDGTSYTTASIRGAQGEQGIQGIQGVQGEQGLPGSQGEKGEKGDTGLQGPQGIQGIQGNDGVSPTVTTASITGGTRITITDANGTHTFDVMNGVDGMTQAQIENLVLDTIENVGYAEDESY